MENENKNTPVNTKGQNNKNKVHKHRSYFLKPNEHNNSSSVNTGNQKSNHSKSADGMNNSSTQSSSASEAKHFPAQKASAEKNTATIQQNQNKATNHGKNRNKRKHQNDEVRRDMTNVKAQSAKDNSANDVLIQPSFMPRKSDKFEKASQKKLQKFSETTDYSKYSDYEEFSVEELYGDEPEQLAEALDTKKIILDSEEPLVEVVGIRFTSSGKTYYFDPAGILLKNGSHAIVETARGLEYGDVALSNTKVKESEIVSPLRSVIRMATDADIKHHDENKLKEEDAFRICNEKIIEHELDMKLIDAQYTFDNSKLLFYFTSSGRVDFRGLVKDLAGIFRTRIELRQIGIRDEAKMIGGLGLCGRSLCCSLFLTDFGQVTIKMAKEQNLSLNASKISGVCGRLMCCLRYEHEVYDYETKRTPPVDSLVRTVDGVGIVTEVNPIAATIKVRLNDSPDIPAKTYKRDEVTVLKKKKDSQA